MPEAEPENRLVCCNCPLKKALFLDKKGIFVFLIQIGRAAKEKNPVVAIKIRDPVLPDLDNMKLKGMPFRLLQKQPARLSPGRMLQNKEFHFFYFQFVFRKEPKKPGTREHLSSVPGQSLSD